MRLSVIMPTYNHAHFLPRAVAAMAAQSLPPDELILIDDGSTDDTPAVIKNLENEYSFLRPVRINQNSGTNAAVQQGLSLAKGTYVYFAGADDEVESTFFEDSINLLETHPGAAFCSAWAESSGQPHVIYDTPPIADKPMYFCPETVARLIIKYGIWFPRNTSVYRRIDLDSVGAPDPTLGPFSDAFLCMTLALSRGCGFIPKIYCKVHSDENSLSSRAANNGNELAEIFARAESQMEGPLAAVFPDDVVRAWGSQWRYSLARQALESRNADRRLNFSALSPPLNSVDLLLLKWIAPISKKSARAYVLFRISPSAFLSRVTKR